MSALSQVDKLIASLAEGNLQDGGPEAAATAAPAAAGSAVSSSAQAGGATSGGPQKGTGVPPKGDAVPAAPVDEEAEAAKLALVLSVGEECQSVDELKNLLRKKPNFVCYDGFEPSGRMHIAQGLFKAINVNKLTQAGGTFVFWVADWFAFMNDKMGGDLAKIQTVGRYLIEVWKAAGMDMSRVRFLWCAEEITGRAAAYWPRVLDIARAFDLDRIKKCCTIMARAENALTGAQVLYPLMQCADIFFLQADVCQLGVDQRKVNMLARDYCSRVGIKLKPVILSHHMLYGLAKGQAKMSKSDPDSAVFMEDTAADVERKIRKAHCPRAEEEDAAPPPPGEDPMQLVEDRLKNPCIDYVRHIVLGRPGATFAVGGRSYSSADEVQADYCAGKFSEDDLKTALIEAVNALLQPVRDHFDTNPEAKALLEQVRGFSKEPAPPRLRRLAVCEPGDGVAAVFLPVVGPHLTLGDALQAARLVDEAPPGAKRVMWVRDWTALAMNAFGGSAKHVRAAYEVLLAAVAALRPGGLDGVEVLWQSEAILKDPSDYWISVIAAGRQYSLGALVATGAAPANQQAGYVVQVLMHCADVLALCPAHAVCAPGDAALCAFAEAHRAAVAGDVLGPMHVAAPEAPSSQLRPFPVEGLFDADCEVTLLDHPTNDVSRKMKKAFCEPGNVDNNPPLRIAAELVRLGATLKVTRKPENGGDAAYTDVSKASEDFASGALHPGDLKPGVAALVTGALTAVQGVLHASPTAKKAESDLKQYLKQAAKKK